MEMAIYLNGVFESVLDEIIDAQTSLQGLTCYLQPYSSSAIVKLKKTLPTQLTPILLYISTSKKLDFISYQAKIVGWQDKRAIDSKSLMTLNEHIRKCQPKETDIYMETYSGKQCVNLISVIEMTKLITPIHVSTLKKISDSTPLRVRSTAGGWSYVKPLPKWVGHIKPNTIQEEYEEEFQSELKKLHGLSEKELMEKASEAPRYPEQIQIISKVYKRNPAVAAAVLKRANGVCECCGQKAPFIKASDNNPYLEIHHIVPLAEGGEDSVKNAQAACPNCHREKHFGR